MIKIVLTEDDNYVYVKENSIRELLKTHVHSGQLVLEKFEIALTNICSIDNFNEVSVNMNSIKGMYSFIDEESKLPPVDRINPIWMSFLK
ncbi:hypothetical protein [Clostridium sp.]|uniref:hypothetical protein n=1 Tax=Clostridium sp. TaxID=1506 RepID=UPI0039959D74